MLNAVPLSLQINGGLFFKKWVWLAKFLQTEPPLKKFGLRPCYFAILLIFIRASSPVGLAKSGEHYSLGLAADSLASRVS